MRDINKSKSIFQPQVALARGKFNVWKFCEQFKCLFSVGPRTCGPYCVYAITALMRFDAELIWLTVKYGSRPVVVRYLHKAHLQNEPGHTPDASPLCWRRRGQIINEDFLQRCTGRQQCGQQKLSIFWILVEVHATQRHTEHTLTHTHTHEHALKYVSTYLHINKTERRSTQSTIDRQRRRPLRYTLSQRLRYTHNTQISAHLASNAALLSLLFVLACAMFHSHTHLIETIDCRLIALSCFAVKSSWISLGTLAAVLPI